MDRAETFLHDVQNELDNLRKAVSELTQKYESHKDAIHQIQTNLNTVTNILNGQDTPTASFNAAQDTPAPAPVTTQPQSNAADNIAPTSQQSDTPIPQSVPVPPTDVNAVPSSPPETPAPPENTTPDVAQTSPDNTVPSE